MTTESTEVGKTVGAGYQVGVRRTLPYSEERIWEALLSADGLTAWLGGTSEIVQGVLYAFENGTSGEIRVYKPWSHLRLTWQPRDWARPSTLQIRVMSARSGTTVSIHQEQLNSASDRNAMKAHWERVLGQLIAILETADARPTPRSR